VKSRAIAAALFALTTFVSAFLLFQVQPLLSKRLLPWFGGSPAVWTTCVLFFQTVLFAGYAYAHASEHWLGRRVQTALHIFLLAAAFALLPILPGDEWKPTDGSRPISSILVVLGSTVGLAYFLLSSTGPLVSAWYNRVLPDRSPYRLYALSNFGSLLALLSYPFVFEPALEITDQADYWAWGFRLFALFSASSAVVALMSGQTAPLANAAAAAKDQPPNSGSPDSGSHDLPWRPAWIALPAFASLAFLATTNFVCQDVAVVPFLWVAPLSLYLLSFIICFDHERWYRRRMFAGIFLVLVAVGPLLYLIEPEYEFVYALLLFFSGMFCVCMICHGELVRLRPPPRHLTAFYLSIAAGGAIGGVLVSVVAPAIFSTYYEWPLALIGGVVLACGVLLPLSVRQWVYEHRLVAWLVAAMATLVVIAVARDVIVGNQVLIWQARNFYGVVTVTETKERLETGSQSQTNSNADERPAERFRMLRHGQIIHGIQFVADDKRRLPVSYFTPQSGLGQTLSVYQDRNDVRVGITGLGVGTIAAYARPGHTYRFYEINPQIIELAREHFTYLADCQGKVEIVEGDARLSLEREKPNEFDVLILDAFSGDAVPTHLLTTEAFEIYNRHIVPDGALLVHVSNRYLDLRGIVRRLAERHGYGVVHVEQPDDDRSELGAAGVYGTDWMVLSKNRKLLAAIDEHVQPAAVDDVEWPLWTDAHTDLFRILK
jgi:predicted membrane-bound spermidine synthase